MCWFLPAGGQSRGSAVTPGLSAPPTPPAGRIRAAAAAVTDRQTSVTHPNLERLSAESGAGHMMMFDL